MDKAKVMKIIAIQGDALDSLKLQGDSSLYMGAMIQCRGYQVFWYEPQNLYYSNGSISAIGSYISVEFDEHNVECTLKYTIINSNIKLDLTRVNCILIRQNPPVDMSYIASSHLLSILSYINPSIFFINHPDVIINYGEKFLPLIVCPENIPKTLISSNITEIQHFSKLYKKSVIKPIYGYGGHDVVMIEGNDLETIKLCLQQADGIQLIVQEFLPEVYLGDKRIIVCNGSILGAVGRVPEEGNFLTNTIAGGMTQPISLSNDEELLCTRIAKKLHDMNIVLAGIDMIGSYITEINITSVGLLTTMHKIYGGEIMKKFFDMIDMKSTES